VKRAEGKGGKKPCAPNKAGFYIGMASSAINMGMMGAMIGGEAAPVTGALGAVAGGVIGFFQNKSKLSCDNK